MLERSARRARALPETDRERTEAVGHPCAGDTRELARALVLDVNRIEFQDRGVPRLPVEAGVRACQGECVNEVALPAWTDAHLLVWAGAQLQQRIDARLEHRFLTDFRQ